MERTERVILTNLCMIQDGTKVLVQEKVGKDAGGIIFPGGHVEEHEPIVDSVIREMKEETGLVIRNPRLVGVKQFPTENGRYVVLLFKAEEFTGALSSYAEGQVEWVPYDRLSELRTVDDFEELLKVMNSVL